MGEPAPAEGAPAEEAPAEEEDGLSEEEILKRIGQLPLEPGLPWCSTHMAYLRNSIILLCATLLAQMLPVMCKRTVYRKNAHILNQASAASNAATNKHEKESITMKGVPKCASSKADHGGQWRRPFQCLDSEDGKLVEKVGSGDTGETQPWDSCGSTDECNMRYSFHNLQGLDFTVFPADLSKPPDRVVLQRVKDGIHDPIPTATHREFFAGMAPDQRMNAQFEKDKDQLLATFTRKLKCGCGLFMVANSTTRRSPAAGCYKLVETWRIASFSLSTDDARAEHARMKEAENYVPVAEEVFSKANEVSSKANEVSSKAHAAKKKKAALAKSSQDWVQSAADEAEKRKEAAANARKVAVAEYSQGFQTYMRSFVWDSPEMKEAKRLEQVARDAERHMRVFESTLTDIEQNASDAAGEAERMKEQAEEMKKQAEQKKKHALAANTDWTEAQKSASDSLWKADFRRDYGWLSSDTWNIEHGGQTFEDKSLQEVLLSRMIFEKGLRTDLQVNRIEISLKNRKREWEDIKNSQEEC